MSAATAAGTAARSVRDFRVSSAASLTRLIAEPPTISHQIATGRYELAIAMPGRIDPAIRRRVSGSPDVAGRRTEPDWWTDIIGVAAAELTTRSHRLPLCKTGHVHGCMSRPGTGSASR